jgi:hypothetical protein
MTIKGAINKVMVLLTRYQAEKITGSVTVTFNFNQGTLMDTTLGVKHKVKD